MNTNLEYYKFFYYVGKLHSITLAAEELNVSQPAVSQAIRNLERELGTTLFMRTSRGVRLTAEGQTLYGYVQRGYETIREGERKFLEMQELTSGEVCIGASDMTLQFYLLSYLEQFHEQYPKIRITVTNAPTPETLKYLQSGRIDFGVVSTPMETTKNMHVIPVREIEDVFVAGRKFEYLKGGKLSYKELEHLPVMCLEGNTSTRKYVEEFLLGEGVVIHPEIELATSDMLIQFAVRNLGIASVVRNFAEEHLTEGDLFELPEKIEVASDSPESWVKNIHLVDLWAQEMKYQTHDVNWFKMPDGSLVCSLSNKQRMTIPCPDALGMVNLPNGSRCGMQEALDRAYLTLIRDHQNDRMLWDLQAVRKWGKSPATAKQLEIIKKRCKGFDVTDLSKGEASQIMNRLFNAPKKRRGT